MQDRIYVHKLQADDSDSSLIVVRSDDATVT